MATTERNRWPSAKSPLANVFCAGRTSMGTVQVTSWGGNPWCWAPKVQHTGLQWSGAFQPAEWQERHWLPHQVYPRFVPIKKIFLEMKIRKIICSLACWKSDPFQCWNICVYKERHGSPFHHRGVDIWSPNWELKSDRKPPLIWSPKPAVKYKTSILFCSYRCGSNANH